MTISKEQLMFRLDLSPEQFKDRLSIAGLKFKDQYSDQEISVLDAIGQTSRSPQTHRRKVTRSGTVTRTRQLSAPHKPYDIGRFELDAVDVSQVEDTIAQNQQAYEAFKDFLLQQARAEGEALGEQISVEFRDAIARGRAKGAYESLGKPTGGSAA
jgi:hypothetical protein